MQTTRNAKSLIGLWGLALVFLVSSCSQFDGSEPSTDSDLTTLSEDSGGDMNARMVVCEGPIVEPTLWTGDNGGNATCADVCNFEFSSGRNNFEEGEFEMPWPEGLKVWVKDGKYIYWSFDAPDGYCLDGITVIVKGGPASNIYNYGPGVDSDCGLHAPINPSGKPAALSNLTFCYNLKKKYYTPY